MVQRKRFWSVNVGLRTDIGASIPKNMFDYLRDADQFDLSREPFKVILQT